MAKEMFSISSFDGGLNTKITPIHGAANESPVLQNVSMDLYGAVGTRNGSTAVATITTSIWRLQNYTPSTGSAFVMAFAENGNGYLWNSATTLAVVSGMTGFLSSPSLAMSRQFQDKIFVSDGLMTPQKYDGTAVRRWGVPAPTATATVGLTAASTGSLTGLYRYAVLGENSYAVKGNYGPETATFSAFNNQMNISGIPEFATSVGITKKWIVRNVASAVGVYYLLTNVTNGVTAFTDNTADSLLVDLAPTDNGVPPEPFTYFVPFQGRMFGSCSTGSNKSRLYYSEINDPEIWHVEDYFEIGQGDGMKITGLGVVNNGLVIQKNDNFGRGAMYLLYMPNTVSDNWSIVKLDVAAGGIAPKAMTNFMSYMSYVNSQGVYTISEDTQGSTVNVPISLKIDPSFLALTKTLLYKAASISYNNKLYISVPSASATTYNDYIYVYDYLSALVGKEGGGMWTLYTGRSINDFTEFGGALYGSSNDGHIYQLETGHADSAAAIDSRYSTMIIWGQPEHENYYKNWRYLYLTVETTGAWNMQVSYSTEFVDGSWSVEDIDLTPGGAIFSNSPGTTNAAIFGISTFGGALTQKKVKIILSNATSRNIQLKFSTAVANQYFKVHDVEIHYNLRSTR